MVPDKPISVDDSYNDLLQGIKSSLSFLSLSLQQAIETDNAAQIEETQAILEEARKKLDEFSAHHNKVQQNLENELIEREQLTEELMKTLAENQHQKVELQQQKSDLQQQEALLRTIFDTDPGALAVVSGEDFTFQFVNPSYREITPHPEIDPVGHPYLEIWPAGEGFQMVPLIKRVMEMGDSIHTLRHKRTYPGGRTRYFTLHLRPILWNGQPAVFSVLWENTALIFAQRTAEEAAEEAHRKANELKALMDAVPAYIWIARDAESRMIEGNQAGNEILRMQAGENLSKTAPEDEIPRHFQAMTHGRVIQPTDLPVQTAAAKGVAVRNFEFDLVFNDGQTKNLLGNATPLLDDEGKSLGAVGAFIDISELKKAEETLKENTERFRMAIEASHAMIYDVSMDPVRMRFVSGLEDLLGYRSEEVPLTREWWIDQMLPEDFLRATEQTLNAFSAGTGYIVQYRMRHKNGQTIWAEDTAKMVRDKDGRVIRIVGGVIDITRRKEMEQALIQSRDQLETRVMERTQDLEVANEELLTEIDEREQVEKALRKSESELIKALDEEQAMRSQLIQAEKNTALARMVASVAHELNNPIQTIQNCMFLLKNDLSQEAEQRRYMEMAISESKRIASLVAQLRDLYRPAREMPPQTFNIVDTLEKVNTLLVPHLSQHKIVWNFTKPEKEYLVNGIEDQLKQVFINISLNAIDAMEPQGGVLSVNIEESENKKRVGVSFKDTGPGIAEENLNLVFEPLFTTKEKGSGLGLAISDEIVKSHHGEIRIKSTPRKGGHGKHGTTFTVWLPLVHPLREG
ncbi:MAG: PAS domain S-box protein [Omnitrophica WOR_2 bacterium]